MTTTATCPHCTVPVDAARCVCGAYVVPLGPLDKILTSNAERSRHWSHRAGIVKTWRNGTDVMCRALRIPALEKVEIHVSWNPSDNRRRDSANCYPTAKAIVDGTVDAGVIPDDDFTHCYGPFMHMGPISKPASMTLAIIPLATG